LDYADAEYVMFCDADDMFFSVLGLWQIFQEMADPFDVLVSQFLEESLVAGSDELGYVIHEDDTTFVHGKVYRLQYLKDQNIRWNEELIIHEDSYFNIICRSMTDNIRYVSQSFYLWKWRDDSVCRHDPKYMFRTYPDYLKSADKLIEELGDRGRPDLSVNYILGTVFEAYYSMNKPEWLNQKNIEFRHETEKHFAHFFNKYRRTWDDVPDMEKMRVSEGIRSRHVEEGMGMEIITIWQWLGYIVKLIESEYSSEKT
jgi:hypothetical protein